MYRGVVTVACGLVSVAGCDRVLEFRELTVHQGSPRALVFDNSSSSTDLVGFPVLVQIDANTVDLPMIANPRTDLRFHDEGTGADLPFEIERWDPTTESELWVEVPRIHAGSRTDRILMYYGPAASGSEQRAAVWSDYAVVFHGDQLLDSASGGVVRPDAQNKPQELSTTTAGQIGNAAKFTGLAGQVLEFDNTADVMVTWPSYTLEFWVYPTYPTLDTNLNGEPCIMSKRAPPNVGAPMNGARFLNTGGSGTQSPITFQMDLHFADGTDMYPRLLCLPGEWSYVSASYDGHFFWMHRNGVLDDVESTAPGSTTSGNAGTFYIGGGDGNTSFTGLVDEVRISRTYHDTDWLFAQYLSMTGHFVTFTDP